MQKILLQELDAGMRGILAVMKPGTELDIMDGDRLVAHVSKIEETAPATTRQLGTLKGSVLYMSPDFDATPEEFKEHMAPKPRPSGTMKGTLLYMAPDFDATPEEFREYM